MKQMGRKMGDAKKAESLSNYMTLQIDEMFPTTQRVFDKFYKNKKKPFLQNWMKLYSKVI